MTALRRFITQGFSSSQTVKTLPIPRKTMTRWIVTALILSKTPTNLA
jgi:hypothetical protein